MFPSFLNRAASAALDLADAMLAPLSEDEGAATPEHLQTRRRPQAAPADHPHRRPLRPRAIATDTRRPGAAPRATQPCTTPLPRSGAAPRTGAQARL